MAIVREQVVDLGETASANMTLTVAAPADGSALLLLAAVGSLDGIRAVTQAGAIWNKLQTSDGTAAEEDVATVARGAIWGAFNVAGAGTNLDIDFSGGVTNRLVIFAEYSGNVFLQPNPLDRLSKADGATAPATIGTIDSGTALATREDDELWIGLAAMVGDVGPFVNPQDGFALVDQLAFAGGDLALLEKIVTATASPRMRVDHPASFSGGVGWAGIVVAMRGDLQVPATAVTAPVTSQAVTIRDDVSSEAIANLASQFRSGV